MDGITTVVVVHETDAPYVLRLLALCAEHAAVVKRASWAGVDEVVGFSTVMDCEACGLMAAPSPPDSDLTAGHARRRHLRALPETA